MNRFKKLLILGCAALLASGCGGKAVIKDASLVEANYAAADALLARVESDRFLQYDLLPNKPLIVTSFVNIDNLTDSSTFGRMAAEHVGSRFNQRGYHVVDLRMRAGSIFIQEQRGELVLSREIKDLSLEHDAQAVIVGTYAKAAEMLYVTVKVLRSSDGSVLSSYDYSLPLGPNTRSLLKGSRQ